MEHPDTLRYSREHEWVRVEDGVAVVGITDYAQDALGDIVFVDLPEVGATLQAGEACCEIESTKSVSEVYAPVSGRVETVNESLDEEPEKVNADPYGDGWLFRVEMDDPSEVDSLLDGAAYREMIEAEG